MSGSNSVVVVVVVEVDDLAVILSFAAGQWLSIDGIIIIIIIIVEVNDFPSLVLSLAWERRLRLRKRFHNTHQLQDWPCSILHTRVITTVPLLWADVGD